RFDRKAVEIGHLELGNFLDLLFGDRPDLILVRLRRSLRQTHGSLYQDGNRRSFGDERERAIRIDRNHNRNDQPLLVFCRRFCVERLAEFHDVHALGSEGGAYGGRRRRLAGRDLQLNLSSNLLSHFYSPYVPASRALAYIFSTCRKSSSTGVERPKIVTMTRSVLRSVLTSSTLPEKFVKGPSTILTVSFFSNVSFGRGRSALDCCRYRTAFTSSAVNGTGFVPPPTNPVTRGVDFTACQSSSSISI